MIYGAFHLRRPNIVFHNRTSTNGCKLNRTENMLSNAAIYSALTFIELTSYQNSHTCFLEFLKHILDDITTFIELSSRITYCIVDIFILCSM